MFYPLTNLNGSTIEILHFGTDKLFIPHFTGQIILYQFWE